MVRRRKGLEEGEALVRQVATIDCHTVWREISNFIEGEVTAELRQRMEAHFADCHHCTAILDGTRNVLELVADGKTFPLPQGFSSRLFSRLQETLK